MLYALNVVLKTEDQDDAIDFHKGKEVPATMRRGILKALVFDTKDKRPSTDTKLARYNLFSKIIAAPTEEPVDLSIDEINVIKDAIDIYPTLTYGQIVVFLNPK